MWDRIRIPEEEAEAPVRRLLCPGDRPASHDVVKFRIRSVPGPVRLSLIVPMFVAISLGSCLNARSGSGDSPEAVTIETRFSPGGGCTDGIVERIGKAHRIRLLAYSFTSRPIVDALIAAQRRTGDVEVVLDGSDEGQEAASALIAADVPVRFDRTHAIAHQKVVVFDMAEVEVGSFNFTKQAEFRNSENCNFIRSRKSAAEYDRNWNLHWSHSDPPGHGSGKGRAKSRKKVRN